MTSHNTSLPNLTLRHRPLERSNSVQPDVSFQTSSFYSSKRKPKYPGRSLTEIFTSKSKTRASSSDPAVTLRRRTHTAGAPLFPPSSVPKERKEKASLNRSFSELTWSSLQLDDHHDGIDGDNDCLSVVNSSYFSTVDSGKEHPLSDPQLSHDDSALVLQERNNCPPRLPCENKISDNGAKSDENKCSFVWKVIRYIFRVLFWCSAVILILALLMLLLSVYFSYERSQCELKRNRLLPLKELEIQLNASVVGQKMAVKALVKSLREFEADEMNSLLILWMVGWSGSGKTLVANILKNTLESVAKVFSVIPHFYPEHSTLLEQKVSSFYNSLDLCSYNIVLIDGWDESNHPWQIFEQLVVNHNIGVDRKNPKGKTVIVLSGTHGSPYVNKRYLQLMAEGKVRNSLTVADFESIADRVSHIKKVHKLTNFLVVVPFLPMEIQQVRSCISEEMLKLQKSQGISKSHDFEQITEEVIGQLNLIPGSRPSLVLTGCKRVQPLLHLAVSKDADGSL